MKKKIKAKHNKLLNIFCIVYITDKKRLSFYHYRLFIQVLLFLSGHNPGIIIFVLRTCILTSNRCHSKLVLFSGLISLSVSG